MGRKNNVTRFLDAKGIPYQVHVIPKEKLSALQVAQILEFPPGKVFKSIVLEAENDKKGLLAVIPADSEVSVKKVARLAGVKKVKVATLINAEEKTGLQAGGISPLALINKRFSVFLDASANLQKSIVISAGERGLQIEIAPGDLIGVTSACYGNLCV